MLLGRATSSQDIELLVLRHEVAVLPLVSMSSGRGCTGSTRVAGPCGGPFWCRIGCKGPSRPGAWRTSRRSAAVPPTDHVGFRPATKRQVNGVSTVPGTLWVPRTRSRHATCRYSCTRPPRRSRRSGRTVALGAGECGLRVGADRVIGAGGVRRSRSLAVLELACGDADVGAGAHRVECGGERAVSVADQKPKIGRRGRRGS